jgi:hypothetical protein
MSVPREPDCPQIGMSPHKRDGAQTGMSVLHRSQHPFHTDRNVCATPFGVIARDGGYDDTDDGP